ncbi:MAG TPA: glycoside hydrolase family 3 N-terminal domain-containing protein [Mycobacterium sp.]|nr:glycoside hydrolase family 3 N-terminal domain-containing protein [Mycobacterium sp.]
MPSNSERRRYLQWLQIAVALVVIGGVAAAGVYWFKHRGSSSTSSREGGATSTANTPLPPPAPPVCGDDELLKMPVREKLAQLLMVGVTGADDARNVVAKYHVGGIFIGSWTDLSMLKSLPEITTSGGLLPAAVSVDEEGGRVDRLKSVIDAAPSAREMAKTMTTQQVHDLAKQRGDAMKNLGVTIDFAPVVDVSNEDDDAVIGDRSFSNDPQTVIKYAGAFAQGLRDAGVLPVLKHFPGHGHGLGSADSHTGSVTTPPLSQLKQDDLIPYQSLTTQQPVAVMVGHLDVPGLTDGQPASLSPAAYKLLRDGDYGGTPFGGVVFTDDLSSMKAISDTYGVSDAVLKALQAGADVALWVTTNEVPAVLDRLENAVKANELTEQRINDSLLRVAHMKPPNRQCGAH